MLVDSHVSLKHLQVQLLSPSLITVTLTLQHLPTVLESIKTQILNLEIGEHVFSGTLQLSLTSSVSLELDIDYLKENRDGVFLPTNHLSYACKLEIITISKNDSFLF